MTYDYNADCSDWLDLIPEHELPEIDLALKASVLAELAPILRTRRLRYRRKVALRVLKVAFPVIFLINPAIRLMQKTTPLPETEMVKLAVPPTVPENVRDKVPTVTTLPAAPTVLESRVVLAAVARHRSPTFKNDQPSTVARYHSPKITAAPEVVLHTRGVPGQDDEPPTLKQEWNPGILENQRSVGKVPQADVNETGVKTYPATEPRDRQ